MVARYKTWDIREVIHSVEAQTKSASCAHLFQLTALANLRQVPVVSRGERRVVVNVPAQSYINVNSQIITLRNFRISENSSQTDFKILAVDNDL